MKKLLAFSLLSMSMVSVSAAPCVALDYQEMKDMTVEDLKAEYCKGKDEFLVNFDRAIDSMGAKSLNGAAEFREATAFYEGCTAQSERMWRVLTQKGVDSTVEARQRFCPDKN